MSKTEKQLKIDEIKKSHANLISQEFYSFFPTAQTSVKKGVKRTTYNELVTVKTRNGVEQRLVEKEYPITPDYVKSFVDSCDYKSDPVSAMSMPAPGSNIGDCTSLQQLCSMDLSALGELKKKIDVVTAEKEKQKQVEQKPVEQKPVENEKVGV